MAKRAPPHTAACSRPSAPGEPVFLRFSPLMTVLSRFSRPTPACSRVQFHPSTPLCVLFLCLLFMSWCRSFFRTLHQSLRQISTDAAGVPATTPALSEQWQPVLSLGHHWMEGSNSHSLFSYGNLSYYSSWHWVLHQSLYNSESTNWNQPKNEPLTRWALVTLLKHCVVLALNLWPCAHEGRFLSPSLLLVLRRFHCGS